MIFWIAVFTGLLQLFLEHCMLYVIPLHTEYENERGRDEIGSRSDY